MRHAVRRRQESGRTRHVRAATVVPVRVRWAVARGETALAVGDCEWSLRLPGSSIVEGGWVSLRSFALPEHSYGVSRDVLAPESRMAVM